MAAGLDIGLTSARMHEQVVGLLAAGVGATVFLIGLTLVVDEPSRRLDNRHERMSDTLSAYPPASEGALLGSNEPPHAPRYAAMGDEDDRERGPMDRVAT